VPTARARHSVTETDDVARALDAAAQRWPDDSGARSRLLLRLVAEGHRVIREDHDAKTGNRREAVRRTSGALTGAYPAGYLEDLRGDWPA